MQQVGSLKNGLLEPNPFGPNEVMLGGTPEILFPCPPNPMEVTEAGTPFIFSAAENVANKPTAKTTQVSPINTTHSKLNLKHGALANLLSHISLRPNVFTDFDH